MQFSLRTKVILFCLLVILGLIFRYPTTPHEIGRDSFAVHLMANSISEFGYAKWWLHPASIIGSYPYSTSPSAVPFLLSGISQCTGIDTEKVILLYSMILGIFSIFGAYLMARVIWNNDIFKFLVAFVFSASQGIITFSTWTAHARTLFVISLPLFIYLLLRTRTFKVRCSILTFVILALLLVTHHYIYFTIPIVISYLIIVTIYTSGKYIKSIKIPEKFANIAMLVSFLIMFSIPYFYRDIWWGDPGVIRTALEGVSSGSIYVWISDVMLPSYIRYVGFLIIFVVGGYISLVFKRNKRFEEWIFLASLAGLTPFLYIATYMKWFILPFASLLIGIALTNVAIAGLRKNMSIEKRKYAISFVIIFLLLSAIFTGYYQYLHFLNDPSTQKRYMEERTYVGGLWIKDNVDKPVIADYSISKRISATSEAVGLTGVDSVDLAFGFIDPEKLVIKQIYSPTSVDFYFKNPYASVNLSTDLLLWRSMNSDSWRNRIIHEFNLSYYVENKDFRNAFSRSVQQTKDCLYDNGKIRVWDLDQGR